MLQRRRKRRAPLRGHKTDILRTALRDLHASPNCATCVISDKYVCEKCAEDNYAAYKWRYEDVAMALLSNE